MNTVFFVVVLAVISIHTISADIKNEPQQESTSCNIHCGDGTPKSESTQLVDDKAPCRTQDNDPPKIVQACDILPVTQVNEDKHRTGKACDGDTNLRGSNCAVHFTPPPGGLRRSRRHFNTSPDNSLPWQRNCLWIDPFFNTARSLPRYNLWSWSMDRNYGRPIGCPNPWNYGQPRRSRCVWVSVPVKSACFCPYGQVAGPVNTGCGYYCNGKCRPRMPCCRVRRRRRRVSWCVGVPPQLLVAT